MLPVKRQSSEYRDAITALMKAYELGKLETLMTVKEQIYKDFGNALGDNINATAHQRLRIKHEK